MLKCDAFLGCFGSCDADINTGISSDFTGNIEVEFFFNNVKKNFNSNVNSGEPIIIKNVFTPDQFHCVSLKKEDGTLIKKISFKIHNQCL